jgi:hypothetical protein
MRTTLVLLLLFVFLFLLPTSSTSQVVSPPWVSMIQLIANPEKYNGKKVSVVGYLNVTVDGDSLYLHEEDYVRGIEPDGLWIVLRPELRRDEKLGLHYVFVSGQFVAGPRGNYSSAAGGLIDITRCMPWLFPKSPLRENKPEATPR